MLERVGLIAYKLELPTSVRIHQVFHVSQLKKKVGATLLQVQLQVPTDSVEQILEPEAIVDRRTVNRNGKATSEV